MMLEYTFEKTADGRFQVRLMGEFVCFSPVIDSQYVDTIIRQNGYQSREDFLECCKREFEQFLEGSTLS